MGHRSRGVGVFMISACIGACFGSPKLPVVDVKEGVALIEKGALALGKGDHEEARAAFQDAAEFEGLECQSDYGVALARVQEGFAVADFLVDTAINTFGLAPAQSYNAAIDALLGPFETLFAKIRQPAQRAIKDKCILLLPDGLLLDVGEVERSIGMTVRIGYVWDEAALRVVLSIVEAMQGAFDYAMAHDIAFEQLDDSLTRVFDTVSEFSQATSAPDDPDSSTTEQLSYLYPLRAIGVFPDLNPQFLAVRNRGRLEAVAGDLQASFQTAYLNRDGAESGIVPALLEQQSATSAPEDRALAWVDNGDGIPGTGDDIIVGFHDFALTTPVFWIDFPGPATLHLSEVLGDSSEAVRLIHQVLGVMGDQLEAVKDPAISWRRLGLAEYNGIVRSFPILDGLVPILPEAVEFDFRAFFTNPVGFRDLLPYWYDDGQSEFDVFMFEGEAARASTRESYVVTADTGHFPTTFEFNVLGVLESKTISDNSILPDQVNHADWGRRNPVPYVALQDPSFHGLIYTNPGQLPIAPEGDNVFGVVDSYLANKTLAAYIYFLMDFGYFDFP